jgi:hypothetical protein
LNSWLRPNITIKIARGLAYVLLTLGALTLVPRVEGGALPAQRTQARVSTAPLLTKSAEAVVPVHNWGFATDGQYDWHPYYWLSPTEVLFFTSPTRKQFRGALDNLMFVKIDIRTGKETRLTHLADLFNRTEGRLSRIQVSPDGKWLLWFGGALDRERIVLTSIDGSTTRQWHRPKYSGHLLWRTDSQQWMEVLADGKRYTEYLLYDLKQGEPIARKPISEQSPLSPPHSAQGDIHYVECAVFRANDILSFYSHNIRSRQLKATEVHRVTQQPEKTSVIRYPDKANPSHISLSPEGDRLAYFLERKAGKQFKRELWVADTDTQSTRLLGHLPVPTPERENKESLEPQSLCWLPDGERLSFILNDHLYVLPVRETPDKLNDDTILIVLKGGDIRKVNDLLRQGMDVNRRVTDEKGLLITSGIVPEGFTVYDIFGIARKFHPTLLMYACYYGHLDMVRFLLNKGADVHSKGAFVDIREESDGKTRELIFDITALHPAALRGHTKVAEFLLRNKADKDTPDSIGKTPLYFAIEHQRTTTAELLIRKGADVNKPMDDGNTPLMAAVRQDSLPIVKLLLSRKVNINAKDQKGTTALEMAAIRGHAEVYAALKKAGAIGEFPIGKKGDVLP